MSVTDELLMLMSSEWVEDGRGINVKLELTLRWR